MAQPSEQVEVVRPAILKRQRYEGEINKKMRQQQRGEAALQNPRE